MKQVFGLFILAISLMTVFQNCSGSGTADLSNADSQLATGQNSGQTPDQILKAIQAQADLLMQNPPSGTAKINALIQQLQGLLTQVQNLLYSSHSASVLTQGQALAQKLTADINQLQNLIASTTGASACSFNGQSIANGSSVTSYLSSSVPFGQTCQSQTRTCTNGQLSGAYTFGSCTVQAQVIPSSAAVYACGYNAFAWYLTISCPSTMPYRSLAYNFYAQNPGSGVAIYDCIAKDDLLGENLFPNSCPSGVASNGILGYVSTVQLPNSIPIYNGQSTDGGGNPISGLTTTTPGTTAQGCASTAVCPLLGWVPAN